MTTLKDLTQSQRLRIAKAMISDPSRWGRKNYWANKHGDPLYEEDAHKAARMCSLGAVYLLHLSMHPLSSDGLAVDAMLSRKPDFSVMHKAAKCMGHASAHYLNDAVDHTTVMRMFDLAIRFAEEEEREKVAA